jgi:hypothetical protein
MNHKPRYLFCLSSGYSLKFWADKGLLEREILLIKRLTIDFDVTIFSYGAYDIEKQLLKKYNVDANLIALNYNGKLQIFYSIIFLLYKFNKLNFDVVRSNQFSGSWVPHFYKYFSKNKVFFILRNGYNYNYHFVAKSNDLLKFFFELIQKKIVKNADLIICTSESDVNYFLKLGGKQVIKIYNSVNLRLFNTHFRNKNNFQYDFLVISKFSHQKNLINTIKILGETKKRILLIGDGQDISLNNSIFDLIGKYKNITHLKKLDNYKIPELMNRSNSFVNLAHYEGNPKVVIEAYACGLNLILSDIPAHLEMKEYFGLRANFINLESLNKKSTSDFLIRILENKIESNINTYPFDFEKNYQKEFEKINLIHENLIQ